MTSPARRAAYTVLRRVFEDDAWADRALRGEAERLSLDARDLALATRLAYGAVQRKATLDYVIETLANRPLDRLEPAVVAALRLGIFQLVYLDRVPDHAAVSEAVELAKAESRGGAGLVNAVLRRATREAEALVGALPDATPEQAALRLSHPEWIARLWWEEYGRDEARLLMAANNQPAEAALRVNTLRTTQAELAERLPVETEPTGADGLVLHGPYDAHGAPEWHEGLFMPQSRAAMAVARVLAPRAGERVLDLCAAPGGKTTHLAALMENQGEVVAVEQHPGRAEALQRTARRLGATCVTVRVGDAAQPHEPGAYDRVLVDPPCSDLGTLASRPDARWRKTADQPERLARTQAAILRAGADALAPHGTLVYSTCTISPAENERLIDRFLADHAELEAVDLRQTVPVWQHPSVPSYLQTLPHRDGTEGFFIAMLRKRPAR